MKDPAPLSASHDMIVRCSGVTVKPSSKSARTERVFSVALSEIDDRKEGLQGAAVLKDVPHDLARQLSQSLALGRRYRLSFSLVEVPDPQVKFNFNEDQADRDARAEAGGASDTVKITDRHGRSVTTTTANLKKAARLAERGKIKEAARAVRGRTDA